VKPDEADQGVVDHHFWRVEPQDRVEVTAEAIAARGPALVFCRTKHGADRLAHRLARSGLRTAAIHGDRNQSQRERALAAFRAGKLDVLVATDVAARGIHVDAVPLVVHFDPPADATDYIHRAGRTGRAGADGVVVSLVGREHLGVVRDIQRRLGLNSGVSAADVPSLASPGSSGRPVREPQLRTTEPHRADRAQPPQPASAKAKAARNRRPRQRVGQMVGR
jgi:superfamily II DNA/RNA helicase